MADALAHRGPDGAGCWICPAGTVGFGHRMLAIQDPAPGAAQPMHYRGRYTITYNGEIYNFRELRHRLAGLGHRFVTESDTEVLLACYDQYGPEAFLSHLDGMFAFALYDHGCNQVVLARDRFGEKPLYYYHEPGKQFLFGSEMKSLWAAGVPKRIENAMLARYLTEGLVSHPDDGRLTFFEGCFKVPPAHCLTLDLSDLSLRTRRYFDIDLTAVDDGLTTEAAVTRFQELFERSVRLRLQTRLPVGSSLSGGLDSSAIVAHASRLLEGQSYETFSAVFPGFANDESSYVRKMADQYPLVTRFTTPDVETLIRDFDRVVYHQEEPFVSPSISLQFNVMQLAKQHGVAVLLDGDGADETLAGYHYYYNAYFAELRRNDGNGYGLEREAYRSIRRENHHFNGLSASLKTFLKVRTAWLLPQVRLWRNRLQAASHPLFSDDFKRAHASAEPLAGHDPLSLNEALYFNVMKLGLQDELRYSDRNGMAHGREVRLPFLSHELVAFLFTLPARFKIQQGYNKWILRKACEHRLPAAITWRKSKIGYEPPSKEWLRDPRVEALVTDGLHWLRDAGVLSNQLKRSGISPAYNATYNLKWRILSLRGAMR